MPRVTISEPGKTPQPYRFELDRKIIKVGRGSDNDIVIECRSISTNHCTMKRVKGGYILRDDASTNGIKKDDSLMEIIDLFDEMEVLVGDVSLKFQLSEDEIEQLEKQEFSPHQKKKLPPIEDDEEQQEIEEQEEEDKPKQKKSAKSGESGKSAKSAKSGESGTPPPATPYPQRPQLTGQSSGSSFKTLLVFILIIVAVFTGMTLRHKMRTGDFLPTKIMNWANGMSSQEKSGQPEEPSGPDEEPPSLEDLEDPGME